MLDEKCGNSNILAFTKYAKNISVRVIFNFAIKHWQHTKTATQIYICPVYTQIQLNKRLCRLARFDNYFFIAR